MMMKSLLTAVAALAVLHFLLVVGFAGWVVASGRMDDRRWGELVAMLSETTADRDSREANDAAAADEAAAASGETLDGVPLTAEQQIDRKLSLSEADRQVVQRMRREVDDLRRALQAERTQLDIEREAFVADRDQFESARERIKRTEGDEQFEQVLATLKSMRPELAHSLMSTTITQQLDGIETVTAYLDRLPARNRAKIIEVFNENDPVLAADLLERLRIRGTIAAADGRD